MYRRRRRLAILTAMKFGAREGHVGVSIKVSDLRLPQMLLPPGEAVVVDGHCNSWMAIAFRARRLRPLAHGGQLMPETR
jgi:hypothetical protein